ncbi:unnamed protein product [Mytilus coruscus]|uniref:MAM domain-containing protein n=1 Tax=Mytilus coruscus TaxID=42192 RepID=A0A6J8C027_MYTCO|nr:unnamed protein product [Mytilus coruscus]
MFAGFQENIFLSNSNSLSCGSNTTIEIVDLKVQQYTPSCPENKQCNLTEEQTNAIKMGCNGERSCTISTIIPNKCDFNNIVSFSYSCAEIVNSSCTFDNGSCHWTVSRYDKYEWTRWRGRTSKYNTGPNRDHTTSTAYGYYVYTKSEIGSKSNDTSDLQTELIVPSPEQCLTFWYHMYGEHINTLKVFQLNNEQKVELWSKANNQGDTCHFQSLLLEDIGPYRIMFSATRGDGYKSDIAIDDVYVTNTACMKASTIDCNFETDKCGWATEGTIYKWTQLDVSKYYYPGPVADHTHGTADGHFIRLKGSNPNIPEGMKSNLTSSTISPGGNVCFTFWYYMYEESAGTLNVYIESGNITKKHWSQSATLANSWKFANLDISKAKPYRIIFEGIRGDGYWSEIALDDILLLQRSCSDKRQPTDKNKKVNKSGLESRALEWLTFPTPPVIPMLLQQVQVFGNSGGVMYNKDHSKWQIEDFHSIKSEDCLINYSQSCHKTDESISFTGCSKYYLQLNKTRFMFDREYDDCSAVYKEAQTSIITLCNEKNNSDICTFNLSEAIGKYPRCFQSNTLLLNYTCKERVPTTLSEESQETNVSLDRGLVVGMVVAIVLLACVVVIICLVRRHVLCRKPKHAKEKQTTGLDNSGFVGNRSASLISGTDNINNQKVEYIGTHDNHCNMQMNESTSFIKGQKQKIDPTNLSKDLDHYETRFAGSESYARANLSRSNENKQNSKTEQDDIYCQSEEGTYDISGYNRHKEADGNIYSHTVDDVYDSTTHKRNDDDQEDKYDHFIGHKTEDVYDTSMHT